jgi:hypothetical protein
VGYDSVLVTTLAPQRDILCPGIKTHVIYEAQPTSDVFEWAIIINGKPVKIFLGKSGCAQIGSHVWRIVELKYLDYAAR